MRLIYKKLFFFFLTSEEFFHKFITLCNSYFLLFFSRDYLEQIAMTETWGDKVEKEAMRVIATTPEPEGLKPLIANRSLKEDLRLSDHLSDAVKMTATAIDRGEIKQGERTENIFRQLDLFDTEANEKIDDRVIQILSHLINSRSYDNLKRFISLYNQEAMRAASGAVGLFDTGIMTREDIFDLLLNNSNYDIRIIKNTTPGEAGAIAPATKEKRNSKFGFPNKKHYLRS